MKFHEPTEQCVRCKGSCCKSLPGICHPDDIKKMFPAETMIESVELALNSRNFSIDWWEGDIPLYYVRPATVEAKGKRFDPSWGGRCVFLTETGCQLSFDVRPYNCKALKPANNKTGCKVTGMSNSNLKLHMGAIWKDMLDFNKVSRRAS